MMSLLTHTEDSFVQIPGIHDNIPSHDKQHENSTEWETDEVKVSWHDHTCEPCNFYANKYVLIE